MKSPFGIVWRTTLSAVVLSIATFLLSGVLLDSSRGEFYGLDNDFELVYPLGLTVGVIVGVVSSAILAVMGRVLRPSALDTFGYPVLCASLCTGVGSMFMGTILFSIFLWTPHLFIPPMLLFAGGTWISVWITAR